MANGDDFDPNPPGTMTGLGLSPDDPLYDWGSNMKPSDLQQYVHDPEGFKQNMINSGQPPPDHNYVQGSRGLQAVDQNNQPIRQLPSGKLAGNITSPLEPRDSTSALGFADPITGAEVPGTPANPPPSNIGQKLRDLVTVPPNAPIRQPGQIMAPGATPTAPAAAPALTPGAAPEALPPTAGSVPLPQPRPADAPQAKLKAAIEDKEKADRKVEAYSSEAMSDFAKSMQGVQVPKRPALPGVGTPGVRSPVGIQPGIQNLLALAGQGRPASQQLSLMKLLGRA